MFMVPSKSHIAVVLLFVLTALATQAQTANTITFKESSWEKALQTAQKEKKPIFLYASTPACRYCKQMEREVFPVQEVASFYNSTFINFKINIADGAEGEALARKYDITGFPTYIYLNTEGQLLHQSGSGKSAEEFIQDGQNAFNPDKALFSLKRRYDQGEKSPSFLFQYSNALANFSGANSPREKVVSEYLQTQTAQQLQSEENIRFIFSTYLDFRTPTTQYFLKNQDKFLPFYKEEEVKSRAEKIITRTSHLAGNQGDSMLFKEVMHVISTSFKEIEKTTSLANIYYYRGQQDWLKCAQATLAYGKSYGSSDWRTLYETSVYLNAYAEKKGPLKLGTQLMQQVIKLSPSYENLHLYAQLQHKAGENRQAVKTAKEAVKVAKRTGEDYQESEDLIALISSRK
ncbi:thioredoxin family protein [Nibribacter koreensis]|uniref:Thioredoxin domain-containing protein n=1 Tax=Nibribacter koreensis TaxID=1084519 RepID=A0ABP8FUG1_9BACT